jgi:hypothetical protein
MPYLAYFFTNVAKKSKNSKKKRPREQTRGREGLRPDKGCLAEAAAAERAYTNRETLTWYLGPMEAGCRTAKLSLDVIIAS